jgi:hypothetical protein
MVYTGLMSKRKSSARGRTTSFDEGRGAAPKNGANKDTYTFGDDGKVIGVSESMKKSLSSGKPGHEWHPADPANGVGVHHTYMEYADGCSRCDKLETKGIHPNGS